MQVVNGTLFVFAWQQRVFDGESAAVLNGTAPLIPSAATGSISVRPNDIVVINVGLDDVSHGDGWREAATSQAPLLAQSIAAARARGVRVIFRTSSPVCTETDMWGFTPTAINQAVEETNQIISNALEAGGVPVADVTEVMRQVQFPPGEASVLKTKAVENCDDPKRERKFGDWCDCRGYLDKLHPKAVLATPTINSLVGQACERR